MTARAPLRAGSQAEAILAHLSRGFRVTPMLALERWGCYRLAARVRQLRDRGHPINGALVSRNGKRFGVYWMTKGGR